MGYNWILDGHRNGDPLASALYGPLMFVLGVVETMQGGGNMF
ncbi:hypothetical protein [Nocardia pseudobrasiliensis]|uniref:Uncharacterized protein n=1 Tax=Nocardia pseudobrasiliensis TaxID=45979 RepID=A0A370HM54_9NOCA|nr:hypothetical protein [Nocardia pseudobrasiliensis]RDI59672.1 hypothetical protein DFR76_1172 [Nocardia pseudobrasiliensis]